jgi:GTP-binding protein
MTNEYQVRVQPQVAANEQSLRSWLADEYGFDVRTITAVRILRRSIDARQRTIFVNLKVRVFINEQPANDEYVRTDYPDVSERPQIIAANKMDTDGAEENLKRFREAHPDLTVYPCSTLTHKGLDEILYAAMEKIEEERAKSEETEEKEEVVVYRYEPKRPDFEIVNLGNRRWKVNSAKVDRLAEQVNFDNMDDTYAFAQTLAKMGIDNALREAGCKDGDQVIVGNYIMDFTD